jgi:glutamate formiminotransferase / formiminotetrahydrofolate cyclodeaminase
MPSKIVECVPNFSEGRDRAKIKAITDAIEAVSEVKLLDVDPGPDTNRTVVTFVGSPEAVAEGAFQAIAKAAQVIDMRQHHGSHPRMGATDVCPFVPVEGVTLDDCAEIAHRVGRRVGDELGISVYFYEAAARDPRRRNLADVRRGEYEGLAAKLKDPAWKPDCGPATFNAQSGATIMGAREFLIAYNVTLNTKDAAAATDIAFELREKGRVARAPTASPYYAKGEILFYKENHFPCGNCDFIGHTVEETEWHCNDVHHYDLRQLAVEAIPDYPIVVGHKVRRAGEFKFCKAIGWYADAYGRAQISINLTNFHVPPPHLVLERARELADDRGLVVTGSEVVGVIPYAALLEAGKFYLGRQGRSPHVPVADVLETAVHSMGLGDVQPFDLQKKVIGLPAWDEKALVAMRVADFVDEVSRDTPAPGGGSIAALAGSLGAALASMVAGITHNKTHDPEKAQRILAVAEKAQAIKDDLLRAVDADTAAFNAYLEAVRLPKATPEEQRLREERMQAGLKQAVAVPYPTALAAAEAMRAAHDMALHGHAASATDAAVGCQMAFAGVRGGVWNVLVNLKSIKDAAYVVEMRSKCAAVLESAQKLLRENQHHVDGLL